MNVKYPMLFVLLLFAVISSCHFDSEEELINEKIIQDSLQNNVPSINIINPANNDSLEVPLIIEYNLEKWQVEEGGKHIQYFIDRENRGLHYGQSSITISKIDTGYHSIKLVLATYDFQKVAVADSVMVYVKPAPPNTFSLVVNNGRGSGNYEEGIQVQIIADNIAGKIFDRWTGDNQTISDITASETYLMMPSQEVQISATYTDEPVNYSVEVAPIIQNNCIACHNGISSPLLSSCDEVRKNAVSVSQKIQDASDPMPPSGLMSQDKINTILKWVSQGANCN